MRVGKQSTRLLLGPRYCLAAARILAVAGLGEESAPVCRRLLVTMGGSDPENLTARVIEALQLVGLDELRTTVVVGGSNPHFPELRRAAAQAGSTMQLVLEASNVAELMAAADVAVSARRVDLLGNLPAGLPALLIDVADNQTEVAEELHRRACAIHVGDRSVTSR